MDIILNTWGITSSIDYVSMERLNNLEAILFEKVRQKTLKFDDEGKTIRRVFKYFDLNETGLIDFN